MGNLGYLFAANLFVWGGIFLYLFNLMRKNKALKKDLDIVMETLNKEDKQ